MSQSDLKNLSREELEARVLKSEARVLELEAERAGETAFGRCAQSTPVGRDELFVAIEQTRMPMILTDPNLSDDPIIFANRAFQELSGYSSEELVGRNCRFLQGPDTDPGQVQRIREALAAKTDVALDLLNYRRDGTAFLNELYVSPVLGSNGEVLYHFGGQADVTGYRRDRSQLESAERRQRAIFASSVDTAIISTDRDGLVTDWNTGAERIFGWTTDEMRGNPADRFFTPEDREIERAAFEMRTALENGRASDERWHIRKDGARFFASGEMMPLLDEHGTHLGFMKLVRDRTKEHLAGVALEKARERFETILDTIEAAFAIVEVKFDADDEPVDYRFVEANPAFARESGVDLKGKWVTEFAPNLERFWFETYGRVAKTGEPINFENYAEAFQRWFDVRAVRVGDPEERTIAILFNDVTARRNAEDRLRVSEAEARENAQRVQLALDAGAIIGTWVWDLPTDRFTVDEAFARSFGFEPEKGRDGLSLEQIIETVHPDDREGLVRAIQGAVARGGQYAHQYRVRRTDGKYYWLEANGRVDREADGTPLSFPGVLIDVEERRAVEAERDRVTEMLRSLNDTLEQRVAARSAELMAAEEALRQSQKMEAVRQLTGGLAHDFNNLLAGISGALELMNTRINQGRYKDVEKYMVAAQGASRRAAALTHRLLAFSRRQTLDPKPTNVNTLVNGMLDLVQRTVGPSIAIETAGAPDLWPTLVDPSQLENALLNLCINARDAMPDGGRITIETGNRWIDGRAAARQDMPEGEFLSLCVTDTGVGMTPDVLEKAFDPFYTTKPTGQGTGLGLSMIYGFAKQSGGQVRIHSSVGQGTTVCIFLPRHSEAAIEDDQRAERADLPGAKEGETILVVDDEPTVRLLVTDVLEELGYTAIEATDSSGGLRVLQSDARIDLLISDVGLPGGMNGRQMADAARRSRPDLKVLFITGYAENALLNEGQLEPGMSVLTKPFAVDTLAARVHELISR